MVSIDIQYSRTLRPCTPCSGLEEGYLAKLLQPDLNMIVGYVCCIPRRWPTIDPGLCIWKLHGVPHDLQSSRAWCYFCRFLSVNECRNCLSRRIFQFSRHRYVPHRHWAVLGTVQAKICVSYIPGSVVSSAWSGENCPRHCYF